ncbi:MAG: DUF5658 family protein [Methanoregula sp.]|jgi:hypothetical protein|uniref:DUF5658 family protein n=1 Tax=Methanoregula sp. TaxID=2052170 RepID=UPI0025F3ABE2|nr:DUF5658 family protein [Methanoregula sp.]MCK9630623.1 DUF5658 family protein [Methanoregula sp.]
MPAAKILQGSGLAFPGQYKIDTVRVRQIVIFTLILGSLFLLDIGTTQIILRMGGVELNPLMTGIVTNPALHLAIKSVVLLAAALVAALAERHVQGSSAYLYSILIPVYIIVSVNNLFVILPMIPV